MIHTLVAASPALVVTGGSLVALLILCGAAIVYSAVRTARPEDVPQIVATVCKALRPRRR